MRWSIRYQLLIPLLTLLVGVVAMSAWAAFASANQTRDQIQSQVRQIVGTLHQKPRFPLEENVLDLMKGFSGAEYLLVEPNGKQKTTFTRLEFAAPEPERSSSDWQNVHLQSQVTLNGVTYLYTGVRLERGPNKGASLYLFYPESLWRDALWEAVRPSLIFGVAGGLIAILLTVFLAQRLTCRVQELEQRTRLIAEGNFNPMELPNRNDELRDLSQSVNEMAQRLAHFQKNMEKNERLRLLGQVGGGLAHQLRNGVTGARLAVQVHSRECNGSTDPESLEVALRQLSLLEMHLKRFLELGTKASTQKSICSVAEVLEETVALLKPKCRHGNVDLQLKIPQDKEKLVIQGDAGQLGHLFLNVITNAIEAAGPKGWVQVVAQNNDNRVVRIEVQDSGPGVDPGVAKQLFDPFVTGKSEGVGLGLTVAKQAVEAHQGSIRWSRDHGYTCFSIEIPLGENE